MNDEFIRKKYCIDTLEDINALVACLKRCKYLLPRFQACVVWRFELGMGGYKEKDKEKSISIFPYQCSRL